MSRTDLSSLARQFGEDLQEMLNQTICDNARVSALVRPQGDKVLVGTSVDRRELRSRPVRLRSRATHNRLWLDVSFNLGMDPDEGRFLAVLNSTWAISVGDEAGACEVLHYDYERGKRTYTEAHLQVSGSHPQLEAYLQELGRPRGTLPRLHLPLGGRRFRPCLEDVVEFLIVEDLVSPKDDGWPKVLDRHRKNFRRKQIAALVRRNQDDAIHELERLNYTVSKPSTDAAMKALERLRLSSRAREEGATAVARTVVSKARSRTAKKGK